MKWFWVWFPKIYIGDKLKNLFTANKIDKCAQRQSLLLENRISGREETILVQALLLFCLDVEKSLLGPWFVIVLGFSLQFSCAI